MTATLPDRPNVEEANEQDLRAAVQHALARSGFTFDELSEQAARGQFETVRARMAWMAIGDLKHLAD
ncbi:MAG: hypothetical protein L0I76_20720 [Pseudonocardia sp.]|nr:hypothetical protein [Pseudonocardia sp.]